MIEPDSSLSGSVVLSNEYGRKAHMLGSNTCLTPAAAVTTRARFFCVLLPPWLDMHATVFECF